MVVTRFRAFHVAIVTNIDSRREVNPALVAFEEKFFEAAKALPTEEPPVLLRHFADYKVAAFALVQPSTGMVVVPELRDGPGSEKERIKEIFQWFYARSKDMKGDYGISITLAANVYVFHTIVWSILQHSSRSTRLSGIFSRTRRQWRPMQSSVTYISSHSSSSCQRLAR